MPDGTTFTRRAFLAGTGALALAGLLPHPVSAGTSKISWRMAVPWSAREKVPLQGTDRFVKQVSLLSESRLAISMHASGSLAGSVEVLDAVRSGQAECGQIFAYEAASLAPAAEWFFSVPFGLSVEGLNHWFYAGEGLPLLDEVMRPLGLTAMPMGDTGARPTGWFSQPLGKSGLKGLTAAFPGRLASAVLARAGVTSADFSLSQSPEALYRGDIQALGSRGAYLDLTARFNAAAGIIHAPCGLTPSGRMLFIARREAHEALPAILKKILQAACAQEDARLQADLVYAEAEAERRIVSGASAKLLPVPPEITAELKRHARPALEELAANDDQAAIVHGKYEKFLAEMQVHMES